MRVAVYLWLGAALAGCASGFDSLFQGLKGLSLPSPGPVPSRAGPAAVAVRKVFGAGPVDATAAAQACAPGVQWVDMGLSETIIGREAVEAHLSKLFPGGARIALERVSDGQSAAGFTWHREAEGSDKIGLRGTTYVELDSDGLISYVQEGYEPIFKPGSFTAELLKAVTKNAPPREGPPSFKKQSPRGAEDIVRYLWQEAYPGGATPEEALDLFAEDILYEDFNYEEPFVGKQAVREFVTEFDFPGIDFIPEKISQGKEGCCFTWRVTINGQEGPKGISFYGADSSGQICFIRDIPAPSIKPPPLGSLAAAFDPKLRVFPSA